ncbi:M16 family metallopeptidase [Taibaiella chishuiensis]|uniref:Zinc protease n=1 Tax=Taibaiella chishuiensis TaxID=1434707 RepID=A0A2P8DAQ0_9BACT|nr:M16 family metallopeptidase [Taibaiella chishuiensis]PSK94296.1 zinc protease [Taibaiella chishuiensis]
MLKRRFSIIVLAALLTVAPGRNSALYAQDAGKMQEAVPVDAKVITGKLANGLTYYIRPNSKPEKKAELRLVLNAGSILENDDQQGLAHFMEHMEFNGTRNYPKNKLIDFLQSIGVAFGADLNASTGFDETIYILPIPTDKTGNLEHGFQILEDWAHNALITEADINGERNVVLEELRARGKNAQERMQKKYLPQLLAGSRYADRLPAGKEEILKTFKPETIRSFYRDWYRPDLMAVIVVGDVNVAEAKAQIEKHFAAIKNPAQPRERKQFEVQPYTKASAMVVTDKEATSSRFQLVFPARKEPGHKTLGDYRQMLVRNLFITALNRRYQELTQNANPPFGGAGVYIGGEARGYENLNLVAIPTNSMQTAITAAVAELVKAGRYGFNNQELEIGKNNMLSGAEKAFNERNTTASSDLVEEYIANFLTGEPIPGIENEYNYCKQLLPGITVAEVNAEAGAWLGKAALEHYFALITAPDNAETQVPSDKELLEHVNAALDQEVSANAEKTILKDLLEKAPAPGKIVSETSDKELGATTYTLSNGVKVTVKPTDFKTDEIILTAVKKGGTNNYGPADRSNVNFLPDVVEAMGYGRFTPTAISDALAGKAVGLLPAMKDISTELAGSSTVKDFESLLQLVYLQLTEPRRDEALFSGFAATMKTRLQFAGSNPQLAFIDTLGKVMYNNDPRAPVMIPTVADIEQINIDRVLDIYKQEFSNADGFHFFIVGNVKGDIRPLLEQYIASLPVKGTQPAFKDNGLREIKGKNRFAFYRGQEQKSLVLSFYSGEIPYSYDMALRTELIGDLLSIKVDEVMREKLGLIYSGGYSGGMDQYPYAHYSIQGQFPCGPESVDAILKEAAREINELKSKGPSQKDLDKVKLAQTEKLKEKRQDNSYWASRLEGILFWNRSKERFLNAESVIAAQTVTAIKEAATQLFDQGNQLDAILYPAKPTATGPAPAKRPAAKP